MRIRDLRLILALGLGLGLLAGPGSAAEEPSAGSGVSPVPLTRDDMKRALEDSKRAVPRLPLPPLTEEERLEAEQAAAERAAANPGQPGRGRGGGIANNGRMRRIYLSDYGPIGSSGGRGAGREPDPVMSLDYPFQTMLFWIVSRGNNCTYCMGHQESKLASAGLSDDQIAALDGDWSECDEATRAAFAFTRTLSFAPHTITDADIDALRPHFTDAQITEIILSVAGFNATNRWTGPLRITQEDRHVFLKPTSARYLAQLSRIAPAPADASDTGRGFVPPSSRQRPPLESRAEVEAALEAARQRTPRLTLADASATQALLDDTLGTGEPPQWMRLLAVFPKAGPARIASLRAAEEQGTLDARTKALIFWVAARHDRAWYALGHARQRLRALGVSDDQIFALDQPETLASSEDREIVQFARKITVNPALADDDDFARLRAIHDDKTVAEILYQITQAAFFNRLTEAAGLRLED